MVEVSVALAVAGFLLAVAAVCFGIFIVTVLEILKYLKAQ